MRKAALLTLVLSLIVTQNLFASSKSETIKFGIFGTIDLYESTPHPDKMVLFISGDGGWNKGVIDMAKSLTPFNTLVVGININTFLRNLEKSHYKCLYPAGNFESLSQYLQKKFNFPVYKPPILVGYSSGASLVYALLAQAPVNTFSGGISLGFSPNLIIDKPLCRGSGLRLRKDRDGKSYDFIPTRLTHPWTVLQGTIDKVCSPKITERFVRKEGTANLVILPKVGHGFSVAKNWLPQFKNAYKNIVQESDTTPKLNPSSLKDLPIVERPSPNSSGNTLGIMLSGDGGWASIDNGVSTTLASEGIPFVGLNSLKYFWNRKSPERATIDIIRIIRFYMLKWKKTRLLLVGYSLGGDVLPFIVHRLPQDLKSRIDLVTLLSPSHTVDFEFHLSYWFGSGNSKSYLKVLPEIEKLQGLPLLCFYGDDETQSICHQMSPSLAKVIQIPGGHHYDGNYKLIANDIYKVLKEKINK